MTEPKQWGDRRIELTDTPYPHMMMRPHSRHNGARIEVTAFADEYAAVQIVVIIGVVEMRTVLTRAQARDLATALVGAVQEAEKIGGPA